MKTIRKFLRKIKYELKFLGKKPDIDLNYFSNSKIDPELKNLMNHYGSDKGNSNNQHNFADLYSEIFFHQKNKIENFLEIGLGTNDINIASNMGSDGKPLASLRAWRDYFKNSNIYGADIDKKILKDEDRIKTFYVDQTNISTIKKMFSDIGNVKFDIILDDGLHEFSANICLFENSFQYLKKDGLYIIEDVFYKEKKKFLNYFKNKNYIFSIKDIYHKENIANNCLILIRKNEKI